MTEFITHVLTFEFTVTFVLFLICLFGFGYPTYQAKNNLWILWFLATVLCFIMCIKLAFAI